MSGLATPRASAPAQPKQMSTRLLGMKFMQRAAHSNAASSQPHTPSSEPSHKRRKTDGDQDSSAPTTPASESKTFATKSEIRAALLEQSGLDALAASRRAELGYGRHADETPWVLDVKIPAQGGLGSPYQTEEPFQPETEEYWAESNGRQTYGAYKRKNKTTGTTVSSKSNSNMIPRDSEAESDAGDESEMSESDDDGEAVTPSQQKKRRAAALDQADEAAMAALDTADLAKSSYAKSKATMAPPGRAFQFDGNRRGKRGDKHPKRKKSKKSKR